MVNVEHLVRMSTCCLVI